MFFISHIIITTLILVILFIGHPTRRGVSSVWLVTLLKSTFLNFKNTLKIKNISQMLVKNDWHKTDIGCFMWILQKVVTPTILDTVGVPGNFGCGGKTRTYDLRVIHELTFVYYIFSVKLVFVIFLSTLHYTSNSLFFIFSIYFVFFPSMTVNWLSFYL